MINRGIRGAPDYGDERVFAIRYIQPLQAQRSPRSFDFPALRRPMPLILELQTDEYWQDTTTPLLETVRRRLRSLIKLIEIKRRIIVYSDFEDEIGQGDAIEVAGVPAGTDMDRFRAKARQFLKSKQSHIAVLKLHRNEPLTQTDLSELERIFTESGVGTAEELERIRADEGLGLFVRSLVGLDRMAAKHAFDGFIKGRSLSRGSSASVALCLDCSRFLLFGIGSRFLVICGSSQLTRLRCSALSPAAA